MSKYRLLKQEEISQLEAQHCGSENWKDISVCEDFSASTIWHSYFSGKVQLASFKRSIVMPDGVKKNAGIYHAHIHNCTIGKDVYIAHVKNRIANYQIEEEVYIEQVDCLTVEGMTVFGNGTKVAVLDETGSRELPIYNELTAQVAHLITFCRHHQEAVGKIKSLIEKYSKEQTSSIGLIEKGVRIINCGTLKNIRIGEYAQLEGVSLLNNGTINSSVQAPTSVGVGVIARDFILATGAVVTDFAQLERCFVGQGTILSKQFSAIDSVFFANCQGFHGEAVAVYAGPYTVTHHKSTLLIGGMFSFFNAGSGSNQSNHMYKLGPIHYGVLDRGSKMASDSYIPWPSRIGCFSVVMGKHKNKVDASDFPFSYVIAEGTNTTIIPAVNIATIGTYRDALKWANRDARTDGKKLDLIEFRLFNPYTIQQVQNGLASLADMSLSKTNSICQNEKITIKASSLQRAKELYQLALDIYLGEALMKRKQDGLPLQLITRQISWVDMSGLVLPLDELNLLLEKAATNKIDTIQALVDAFTEIERKVNEYEWSFVCSILSKEYDCEGALNQENIKTIISKYISAKKTYLKLLTDDATKEFSACMQTCFGLDQGDEKKQQEFELLRGTPDMHAFLKKLKKQFKSDIQQADSLA